MDAFEHGNDYTDGEYQMDTDDEMYNAHEFEAPRSPQPLLEKSDNEKSAGDTSGDPQGEDDILPGASAHWYRCPDPPHFKATYHEYLNGKIDIALGSF